jgi:hypothetical protein
MIRGQTVARSNLQHLQRHLNLRTRKPSELTMRNVFFGAICLVLLPIVVLGAPKKKEGASVMFQVMSSRTQIHGKPPNVFSYTDVMFARIDGKNIVFVCDERGKDCPLMKTGETYSAERVDSYLYYSFTSPDAKKPFSARYRETGSW